VADKSNSVLGELSEDNLLGFLDSDCVVTLPRGATKEQLLSYMVELLVSKKRLQAHLVPRVISGLARRERLGTTGLGNGLALPHLRIPELAKFIGLVGISTEGVDFDSLDGHPTRIVILVLSPYEQKQRHFDVLGRLARLFSEGTLQYTTQLTRSPDALLRLLGVNTQRTGRQ
jgi:mannitol/fructose-specific phosphotransferase system IIA component (Ntr-type)